MDAPQPNNPCEELEKLLPAYVLGVSTHGEVQRVEELLSLCPTGEESLANYSELVLGLGEQVEAQPTSPRVKSALMERIAAEQPQALHALKPTPQVAERPEPVPNTNSLHWRYLTAIAAILLIAIGTNLYQYTQLSATREIVQELRQEQLLTVSTLGRANLETITLAANDTPALGVLLWAAEDNQILLVSDQLSPLEPEQTYQLWLIGQDEQIESVGTFAAESDASTVIRFDVPFAVSAFGQLGISIEPAGGSPAPTTDPIAVGSLG